MEAYAGQHIEWEEVAREESSGVRYGTSIGGYCVERY